MPLLHRLLRQSKVLTMQEIIRLEKHNGQMSALDIHSVTLEYLICFYIHVLDPAKSKYLKEKTLTEY